MQTRLVRCGFVLTLATLLAPSAALVGQLPPNSVCDRIRSLPMPLAVKMRVLALLGCACPPELPVGVPPDCRCVDGEVPPCTAPVAFVNPDHSCLIGLRANDIPAPGPVLPAGAMIPGSTASSLMPDGEREGQGRGCDRIRSLPIPDSLKKMVLRLAGCCPLGSFPVGPLPFLCRCPDGTIPPCQ